MSKAVGHWVPLLTVAVLVVVCDQILKREAVAHLDEAVTIASWLALQLSFNTGAAFSMGTGITPVFTIMAAAVVCLVGRYAVRVATFGWAVSIGLIGGGAAGNLADRIFRPPGFARGAVVDFIDVAWFASFNLADTALTIGAGLAVILVVRNKPLLRPGPT